MTLNTTAEIETAKLARGLRERDMELLADLVERYQHRLVRYLLYLTGRRDYAEDLAQETWIRVLQRGSQYNGRQRFDPWLASGTGTIEYALKGRFGYSWALAGYELGTVAILMIIVNLGGERHGTDFGHEASLRGIAETSAA